jgi:hypothetical protein
MLSASHFGTVWFGTGRGDSGCLARHQTTSDGSAALAYEAVFAGLLPVSGNSSSKPSWLAPERLEQTQAVYVSCLRLKCIADAISNRAALEHEDSACLPMFCVVTIDGFLLGLR